MGEDNIDIVKNPNTGKVFFACGDQYGAVSEKASASDVDVARLRITEILKDNKVDGYVMHTTSSNNVLRSL